MGTCVDALNRLKEQRTFSPEGCRVEMPWKCDCLGSAPRLAYEAMVNDDMRALNDGVEHLCTYIYIYIFTYTYVHIY